MGDDYDWEQELNSYRRTTTNRASADGGEAPKASTTPLVAAKTGASPVTPLTLSSPGSRPSGVPLGSPTPSSASSPPPAVSPLSTSGGSSTAPNRALPVPPSKQATTPTPASPPPAYSTAVAAKSPTAASASTPLEKSQSTSNTNNVTSPTTADTKKKTGILGGLFGSKNKDKDKDKDAKPADGNKESKKDDSDSDDDKDTKKGAGAADDDDDEDEKEGNDGWVEFKDEKGVKLWYNTKTRETSIGGPPAGKAGAGGRSSSNAVGDIDMDDEDEDLDEDGQPKARRGEAMVDELGDDQQGPVTGKKKNKQEVMTPEKIVTTLRFIEKQVEHILEHSHTLAPAVCEDLRAIVKSVESCQKQLETSETVDNRGDVDALIEWNKLPWNWDNIHVHGYRAGAARIPHHEYEYKEWHLPQSFSEWPLPPDSKSVTAVVRLPTSELEAKAAKDSATVMTHTRISISEGDTVNKCVASCYAKCKGLPGDATEYVLKASGLADYMDGPKLLFSYEYIRACLRDNIEVKLVMVRRPQPQPDESKDDLPAQYRAKVDPNMEVMSVDAHRGLSIRDKWDEIKAIPLSEQALPFRIRIIGMDKVNNNTLPLLDNSFTTIWLKVFLFHGQQYITESIKTTVPVTPSESPRWMTWLMGDYQKETLLNQLPRACRIGFILFGRKETEKEKDHMLGWASHQLIDQWGRLSSGAMDIRLWPIEGKKKKGHGKKRDLEPDFIFRQTNRDNQTSGDAALLRVKFDEFAVPVVAPLQDRGGAEAARAAAGGETPFKSLHKSQQKRIEEIIESDLLCELTNDDKLLIWTMRHHLSKFPTVLPKFLLCVNWGKPEVKNEALRLLTLWAPPVSLVQALELLDAKYPDYTVREYAVNLLRKMKNDELRLYLLQLVQCLKFEPYHDSPLARFLIERAIRAPYGIGHHFFWHLKAELHSPYFQERFAVILEEYLSHAGRFARELRKQNQAVLKLQRVAEMVVKLKREGGYSDEEALPEYRKEISKLNSDFFGPMGKFQIPLNPQLEATTLIVEKCRYMSSKMVPLWLVFRNADDDAPPIYIIFKSGDDLRQDILTLQILRVMDKMWLGAGLDMRMKPYRVIATGVNDHGEGVGMIEVVLNSDTTSGIQLEYGGGAMGALKMDPIDLFLHNHNKGAALYDKAVQNFIMSCAGYCVATFVLGIGDRHNGNIMVTKDGHLFHIDFGHFLGNFKKKFGVNRERAAFVFTPEMAFVMGGKKYQKSELFKKFLRLCSDSFKTLRGNAITLENLFVLMVSAGMPELMKEQDIFYMRDKLYLNVNEKKADKKLHAEINKSLDSTYRRIDNMIHNLKHG